MPRTKHVLLAGFMPELFKVTVLFLPSPPFSVTLHFIYKQSRIELSWFSGRLNCELLSRLFSFLVMVPLILITLQVACLLKVCVWDLFPSFIDFSFFPPLCWISPLAVDIANLSAICLYFLVLHNFISILILIMSSSSLKNPQRMPHATCTMATIRVQGHEYMFSPLWLVEISKSIAKCDRA